MSLQRPGKALNEIVEQAIQKKSYSELGEEAMSLYNLCCLVVDIQLRAKRESTDKLPGQYSPVDTSLEVSQREGSENEHKN